MSINPLGAAGGVVAGAAQSVGAAVSKVPVVGPILGGIANLLGGVAGGGLSKLFG